MAVVELLAAEGETRLVRAHGPGSAARGGRPPLDGALNPTGLPEPHRTPRWRGFGSSAANEQRRG